MECGECWAWWDSGASYDVTRLLNLRIIFKVVYKVVSVMKCSNFPSRPEILIILSRQLMNRGAEY